MAVNVAEYTGVVVAGLVLAVISLAWAWWASARPGIIEKLERSMVSNQSRLDAQEAETDDLKRQIAELREGRIADHALMQDWITYARRWVDYAKRLAVLLAATGQELPPEPIMAEPQSSPRNATLDMARLARHIGAAFSLDEMKELAFELGIDAALTGDTPGTRSVSLVQIAQRRGLLLRLVELCRRERPEGGF